MGRTASSVLNHRRTKLRSTLGRAVGEAYEPLEARRLMSLLGISLPANPQVQTGGSGAITYTSGNENFNISTTELTLIDSGGNSDAITADPANNVSHVGTVQILVDNGGNLVGGNGTPVGQDILLQGDVTVDGTTYDGTLLTGSIEQFGYQFTNNSSPFAPQPGNAVFDFRFRATGGLLQSLYFQGQDIGMRISATSSSTFSSGFTGPVENWSDFSLTSGVKGFVGPIPPLKNCPTIVTKACETAGGVVGTSTLSDSATISGGYNETGTIDFTLDQPDGTTIAVGSATINGDGTYNSPTVTATEVGTYTWHASYIGDAFNNGAIDDGAHETLTTVPASPYVHTLASQNGTAVVGVTMLGDSASIGGGFNETGTVSFTLTQPDGSTIPVSSTSVNGDGIYSSAAVLATEVGTYTWHASYNGDGLNNGTVDDGKNESVTTVKASPGISTQASESGSVVGSASLTDSATVTGGDSPTGTITFTLSKPDGTTSTVGTATVTGDGTYSSPAVTALEVGTYVWHASYNGDTLNNGAIDNGNNESVTTTKTCPKVITCASETSSICGTATTSDSAILSNGYNETGTITFVLTAPNGTIASTQSVTVKGNGTYTTAAVAATQVGTYTWTATYNGDTLNGTATDQGGPAEQVCFTSPYGSISGTKFQDITGNGFSADDTPLKGVVIDLYKDNGSGTFNASDLKVGHTTTAADGTYSFNNLQPGLYFVQEEVPTGWVETGTPLVYSVQVTAGSSATGKNFDDFQEECNLSKFSCIYYVIDGCKTVTELSGNVQPGDEVVAYATVAPHYSDQLTLVSYIAPDSSFNGNDAYQQVIYDQQTVSFSTGTSSKTICIGPVQIPLCNYQIDFVCGPAINTFGSASSNAFYHNENRMIDSSNGGTQKCATNGSSISGIVFCDKNIDGKLDNSEAAISGATVTLETAAGVAITSTTTGANGSYAFENLSPGSYLVVVTPPAGDTAETTNTASVTLPNHQEPQLNPMGNDADLNFAELCPPNVCKGATGAITFWKSANGQALINKLNGSASSTALGSWLANSFPNLYASVTVNGKSVSFASMSNSQIASFYVTNNYNVSNSAAKLNTQILAAALNCYVTSTTLSGGTYAAAYGFTMSAVGSGYDTVNVGAAGAAFGVANNSSVSIYQMLNATNADSSHGVAYANIVMFNGSYYSPTVLQSLGMALYTIVNAAGGIS